MPPLKGREKANLHKIQLDFSQIDSLLKLCFMVFVSLCDCFVSKILLIELSYSTEKSCINGGN